jgi:DNA-binding transcriptional LysR family regulator
LSGKLRVSAAVTFARMHVVPKIPEFLAQNPELEIERWVIAVSLRHFFPEHWDGIGDDYRMALFAGLSLGLFHLGILDSPHKRSTYRASVVYLHHGMRQLATHAAASAS